MGTITLNEKQRRPCEIITRLIANKISSSEASELLGRSSRPQSQIQRIIEQLGITSIPALSPQAKGRIERLWQTFPDRLRKEMRLADVDSLEQANQFLEIFIPAYNHGSPNWPAIPKALGARCTRNWIWSASSPPPPRVRQS